MRRIETHKASLVIPSNLLSIALSPSTSLSSVLGAHYTRAARNSSFAAINLSHPQPLEAPRGDRLIFVMSNFVKKGH